MKAVALGILTLLLLVTASPALGETETGSQTQTTQSYAGQSSLQFALVPSAGAHGGNGSAQVQAEGTLVTVHMHAWGVAGSTQYTLLLVANGTGYSVANMSTSDDGEVEAQGAISLPLGTYSAGLRVEDLSAPSTTSVLVSSPSTDTLVVSGSTTGTTQVGETQTVSTVQGGETEDGDIRSALQSGFIPAVVLVDDSGSSVSLNDGNFSVSVGRLAQSGYVISISAANVTGPRVVLVDLAGTAARNMSSGRISITLDGTPIQQGSFSQVIGARAGDPPRFVLVSGPSGLRMLISIPHFSYHAIEILPVVAQLAASLIDLPVLAASVVGITVVALVYYSRRARVVI